MINNANAVKIETGSEIGPLLISKTEPPEGPVFSERRTNCAHYSRCGLRVALMKKARNFTCAECNDFSTGEELPVGRMRNLALVKTEANDDDQQTKMNPVLGDTVLSQASSDPESERPSHELFEVRRPYTLADVPVDKIDTDFELDSAMYKDLAVSIGFLGPLQTVILRHKEDGAYEVWAGRRRVLAAKDLGKDKVPAMVFGEDVPESLIDIYAVTENMNRASNPAQEAEALNRIMSAYNWTAKEAAKKLGIPVQQIRNRVKLMKLIPDFLKRCVKGELSFSVANKIASLPIEEQEELLSEEKITLDEVQSVYKETKLKSLLSQDELFAFPETPARVTDLSDVKMTIAEVIRSGEGNIKSLEKALVYIERYESSKEEA